MKDIISSSSAVTELNLLVQQKLAPHLFLCCNYNPLNLTGLNDDGKYYPAITNLYRVAYDSSCVIKQLFRFDPKINVRSETYHNLKDSLDTINILRSIVAHNNSPHNGHRESSNLDEYHYWVRKIIGKDEPDCCEDYSLLFHELQKISDTLYSSLVDYIETASKSPNKEAIVEKWEAMIIDWYCGGNVKRDIFLGELENEYLARAQRISIDRLDIQVARWIQNYYTKETSLANLQSLADMTRDPKSKTAILKAIADRRQVINDDIVDTETKFRDRSPYCYQNRLFADLQNLLLETLAEEKCSMLPDVLLQRQIQKMFANVASPNKDF